MGSDTKTVSTEIVKLRQSGMTIRQIMKEVGFSSPSTIQWHLKKEKERMDYLNKVRKDVCMDITYMCESMKNDTIVCDEQRNYNQALADVQLRLGRLYER